MKTNIHILKRKTFTTRQPRMISIDDEIETFKIGSRVKNNRRAKYAIVLRLTNYMKIYLQMAQQCRTLPLGAILPSLPTFNPMETL